ncbi:MAG: hypothetical protein WKF57_10240 [Nakamurella sp.]
MAIDFSRFDSCLARDLDDTHLGKIVAMEQPQFVGAFVLAGVALDVHTKHVLVNAGFTFGSGQPLELLPEQRVYFRDQ